MYRQIEMKLIEMSDYNRAAKTYWIVMVCAGAVVFVWALQRCLGLSSIEMFELAGLLGLVILAAANPIRIPGTSSSFTAGDVFTFLTVLFLGVPAAILVGMVDSFVSSRRTSQRVASWIAAPAMMALTVLIAGEAFYAALNRIDHLQLARFGATAIRFDQLLGPLALMTMLHYFCNGFSISTIYALKSRQPILKSWRDGYLWTWWSFLASAIATAVIYAAISRFGLPFVALGVPVIAATYWTYKIYFERVNAQTREAEEMSRLHLATVEALATAIDAKDQTTHFHVRRVQIYAAGLGKLLGLSDLEVAALNAGAYLHDVGKLAVPDHILNKPGALTPAEFEKTKVHAVVGAEILSRVNFPYPVLPIVRHHHERWDGRGYPDRLRGEEIPVTARVMAIVDCFDSVREERPFRPGLTRVAAVEMLRKEAGSHFDPELVSLFITNLDRLEAEIDTLGLLDDKHVSATGGPIVPEHNDAESFLTNRSLAAYDQIRNAHREGYALYEMARTFGSSLEVKNTLSVLVDRVGHIVPFDTCVVYLYDDAKGFATAALAVGLNAESLGARCIAPGEGATGFALANRRSINQLHPSLDFKDAQLDLADEYRSMASLPLFKGDLLLGALSIYSMTVGKYSDDQIRLLETVTRLGSDALANAVNHARAESNALTDALTGLPNARCLHVRFEEEVARSHRTGCAFHAIMLDLDEFKIVNDTFGHKIGDRMLREVAGLVQAQLREYDFLARYAGDEFVAILPDLTGDQVAELCERIEKVVSTFSLQVRAETFARVGISVGAAVFGEDGESLDLLLIAADQAMYRAKSTHKIGLLGPADTRAAKTGRASNIGPNPLITTAIN
jgi:diguanylate cyclase (GGDEF)-like protein/putative nucleotidyltransferase with HDIG domain